MESCSVLHSRILGIIYFLFYNTILRHHCIPYYGAMGTRFTKGTDIKMASQCHQHLGWAWVGGLDLGTAYIGREFMDWEALEALLHKTNFLGIHFIFLYGQIPLSLRQYSTETKSYDLRTLLIRKTQHFSSKLTCARHVPPPWFPEPPLSLDLSCSPALEPSPSPCDLSPVQQSLVKPTYLSILGVPLKLIQPRPRRHIQYTRTQTDLFLCATPHGRLPHPPPHSSR